MKLILKLWPFKWKLLSSTFLLCCLFILYAASVDGIIKFTHSSVSYWVVLSSGPVYYAVHSGWLSSLWTKSQSATIQTKATEQHFPVVLWYCCTTRCLKSLSVVTTWQVWHFYLSGTHRTKAITSQQLRQKPYPWDHKWNEGLKLCSDTVHNLKTESTNNFSAQELFVENVNKLDIYCQGINE